MILMPSNNTGKVVKELFQKYPDRIALLLNPDRVCESLFIGKYAVDNAAFKRFDETKFFNLLDYCSNFHKPLYVVAPDVVGCHDRTLALWHYYYQRLKKYEYALAFVAQDGCTPETIPQECDWIFIAGTTQWKRANIKKYIGLRPIHG